MVAIAFRCSSKAISDEALRLFKASPFFGAWHPDVLQLYVTYGLCEDPRGGVKLKMSGLQEALVLADGKAVIEAWELLERIDERIELRWIVPGKSTELYVIPSHKFSSSTNSIQDWRRTSHEGASMAKTCQFI